jgi:hypothetical protein
MQLQLETLLWVGKYPVLLEIGGYGVYQDESKALVVGCGQFYEKEEMRATGRNPYL